MAARRAAAAAAAGLVLALTGCSALPFGSSGEPSVESSPVAQAPATVADLPPLDGVVAGVPEGWTPAAVGALSLALPPQWTDLGTPSPEGWDHRSYLHAVAPAAAAAEALAVSEDGATLVMRRLEVDVLLGTSTWRGGWGDMTGDAGYRVEVPGAELAAVDLTTEPAYEGSTTEVLRAEIHLQSAAGTYALLRLVAPAGDQGLTELRTFLGTLALTA